MNEEAMETEPFQPWDTRLTVYNMRNVIHLHQMDMLDWRPWRDRVLQVTADRLRVSDVGLSWPAADIQLLNAVCKSPAEAFPTNF